MDTNNWEPTPQGREPVMDSGDWRNHLHPDSRQRIVNKIMDTLKKHLPYSDQEGLNELKKIAERFEKKIYTTATTQSDYLQKLSLKMLSFDSKSQNPIPNSLPSNTAASGNSNKPPDQDEMDWDRNGMVNFEEFLFAFNNWAGIDDEEGEEKV